MQWINTDIISAGDKPPPYGYVHHYFFTNALIITAFFSDDQWVSPAGSVTSGSDSPPDCHSIPSVSLRYPYDQRLARCIYSFARAAMLAAAFHAFLVRIAQVSQEQSALVRLQASLQTHFAYYHQDFVLHIYASAIYPIGFALLYRWKIYANIIHTQNYLSRKRPKSDLHTTSMKQNFIKL